MRSELQGQPEIQTRMLATVGSAYNNLGLTSETIALLGPAMGDIRRAGPSGARALEPLIFAYLQEGRLDTAMATVAQAEKLASADGVPDPEIMAPLERMRSAILFAKGQPRDGLRAIDSALALYRSTPNAPQRSHRVGSSDTWLGFD